MEDITVEQVKAARALLNWNQKDLADYADLNQSIIANYESGRSNSYDVQNAIYKAFIANGIKFQDGGVLPNQVSSYFITYLDLLNEVEKTLKPGEFFLKHLADDRRSPPEVEKKSLEMLDSGIIVRSTIPKSADYITEPKENYRKIPDEFAQTSWDVICIYSNRVAFNVEDNKMIVIISEQLAKLFKAQFEYWWDRGEKLD